MLRFKYHLITLVGKILRFLPVPRGKSFITRNFIFPYLNDDSFETLVTLKKEGGGKLFCNPGDKTQVDIFSYGTYKNEEMYGDFLLSYAKGKTTIFDIGANIGYYTIKCANLVKPGGEVHAFEPLDPIYKKLKKNVMINGLGNVFANQAIVSNSTGKKNIHYRVKNSGGSSVENIDHPEHQYDTLVHEVESTTIEAYCKQHHIEQIDVMKIDTEGHEAAILQGMENLLRNKLVKYIFLEFEPKYIRNAKGTPEDLLSYMKDFDYQAYRIKNNQISPFDGKTSELLVLFM